MRTTLLLLSCIWMVCAASMAAAEADKPLTERALQVRKMKSRERDALDARCRTRANWNTSDCLARIEVEKAEAREAQAQFERERKDLRAQCAAGAKEKCIELACPPDAAIFGRSADEVRACSKARGLPSTAKWAQTSESIDSYQQRFGYVCLQPMHFLDAYGTPFSAFAGADLRWLVTDKPGPKLYEANGIQNMFSSKADAIAAACAFEIPRHREFLKMGGATPVN